MIASIDREKVRSSFDRQAIDYDRHAVVQQRVVGHILAFLRGEGVRPARILDIGAGTGRMLAGLRELFPAAVSVGADLALGMCRTASGAIGAKGGEVVNADAEHLPFGAGSFELVVSTSTFQWLTSLDLAFSEAKRVLLPGGLFCFALFGEKTLFELRESYRGALQGEADRSHSFFTAEEVRGALLRAGFHEPQASSEMEVEFHPDVPELLRSLKRIGAGTARPVAARGLSERRVMLEMMESYRRRFGTAEGVPASYEVIYGVGRKP